jgi:hypothetical protein
MKGKKGINVYSESYCGHKRFEAFWNMASVLLAVILWECIDRA